MKFYWGDDVNGWRIWGWRFGHNRYLTIGLSVNDWQKPPRCSRCPHVLTDHNYVRGRVRPGEPVHEPTLMCRRCECSVRRSDVLKVVPAS